MKKFIKNLSFFILSIIMLIFWASKIEPNLIVINEQNLYLPNWNQKLDGLKIAVISDLHIGSTYIDNNKIDIIKDKINSQNPDLILILGDYDAKTIKNSHIDQNELIHTLSQLKPKYKTISVLGNHDFKPDIIRNIIKKSNILLLENENKLLTIQGTPLQISGTKDLWHYEKEALLFTQELNTTYPTILLSHNPDLFPEVKKSVSLTLSGHIHGGQVYIPMLGALFIPSKYGQRYIKGHIIENGKNLYITSGIGNITKFRLGNIPEIIILNLYSQPSGIPLKNKNHTAIANINLLPFYNSLIKKEFSEKYLNKYIRPIKY